MFKFLEMYGRILQLILNEVGQARQWEELLVLSLSQTRKRRANRGLGVRVKKLSSTILYVNIKYCING